MVAGEWLCVYDIRIPNKHMIKELTHAGDATSVDWVSPYTIMSFPAVQVYAQVTNMFHSASNPEIRSSYRRREGQKCQRYDCSLACHTATLYQFSRPCPESVCYSLGP